MNPKISIVTVCYNPPRMVKKVVRELLKYKDIEVILIDNRSPFKTSRYLYCNIPDNHPNVRIIDAGKNIGCHNGYNLGFSEAKGDFLVKNDDSTEPLEEKDVKRIAEFLKENPDFAYIGANFRDDFEKETEGFDYYVEKDSKIGRIAIQGKGKGMVNFPWIMIPKKVYKDLGELKPLYRDASGNMRTDGLYGGEELYYKIRAIKKGYKIGTALDIEVEKLERTEPLYELWKYVYGYLGWTRKPCDKFMKDKELLTKGFRFWLNNGNTWQREKAREYFEKKK